MALPNNLIGSVVNSSLSGSTYVGNLLNTGAAAAKTAFAKASQFIPGMRSLNVMGIKDGLGARKTLSTASVSAPGEKDWRVRLSVPSIFMPLSGPLAPLALTDNNLIFPYTPTVNMQFEANYAIQNAVHTNYPFNAYNYSSIQLIQINADMYVQNSADAAYWVAAVHFLRAASKMRYGANTPDAGAPPPVLKLNGYGDFVFKNVPVIINNVQFDLPKDCDYISCTIGDDRSNLEDYENKKINAPAVGWAPSLSQITVQLLVQYARSDVSQFNLNDFINGRYIEGSGGFI